MDANETFKKVWAGLSQVARVLGRVLLFVLSVLRELAILFWSVAREPVIAALNVLAALVVLFEEWGWRPLSEFLARLARYAPIAAVERWIASLPPYGALVAFALPTSILLPLKLVAVWLLANDYFFTATLLFLGAKIVSTALIARVFVLTKPALMQIPWFANAYNWFRPWKDALFAEIRTSAVWRYGRTMKARVKIETDKLWVWARPKLEKAWFDWTGKTLSLGRAGPGTRAETIPRIRPPTDFPEG